MSAAGRMSAAVTALMGGSDEAPDVRKLSHSEYLTARKAALQKADRDRLRQRDEADLAKAIARHTPKSGQ